MKTFREWLREGELNEAKGKNFWVVGTENNGGDKDAILAIYYVDLKLKDTVRVAYNMEQDKIYFSEGYPGKSKGNIDPSKTYSEVTLEGDFNRYFSSRLRPPEEAIKDFIKIFKIMKSGSTKNFREQYN